MKRLLTHLPLCLGVAAALLSVCGLSLSQTRPVWQAASQTSISQASISQTPTVSGQTPPTDVSGEFSNQAKRRTYYLHTPPSSTATRPLPLVVALHGSGMQGKEMAEKTALSKLADQAGFIVVYPDGLKQKWNVSGAAPEDNVEFVHALIDHMQQLRSIDPQRVYVVGLSNGGILAQKLACEAPDGIAAIATVAASLPVQFSSHCQTQKPVSLLMVNGTADSVVPWRGGAAPKVKVGRNLSIPTIPDVVNFWQQHNSCPASGKVEQPSNLVEVTDYSSCQAQSEVMLVALQGAGHVWAGGGYGQSAFGDTTQRVWQFLQRHSLN